MSQVPSSSSRSPSLLGSSVCKSSKNTTMNDIGSQRNDLPLPLSFFGHQVIKQRISLFPIQADNSEIPNQVIGRANFSRSCALFSTKLAAFKNSYPIFWGPRAFFWSYTNPKLQIDTQNDVFLMYLPSIMAISGINVKFQGDIEFFWMY